MRVLYSPPSRREDAEHVPEHQAQKTTALRGWAPLFVELLRSVKESPLKNPQSPNARKALMSAAACQNY
ncbi:hypothetical protein VDR12_21860, partial [Xanthomonas campestris pv. campestris]|uniref:hypothetical protein n=1 Tax=Xanthomonas campestris TaxID=339 RepID=UPI002B3E398D|nr:hypothetical protein [Xanthomonas campestris pv. campestris]MEB1461129.1 hypothetical protein [Xanthomonas campestris pv. campestris]MEB1502251.1 hypothetical protein [Xanthomonas campestris pv. campestris]MEB1526892.1 hypothetical protein [Xanthomonas campestris pv. campestris]MEB1587355.1 hypothetical protein [Xanthomonas campestris pv. campestris]